MTASSFCKEFQSRVYNVKSVVKETMDFISYQFPHICESDYYDLKLVLSELLINAVIHGNNNDDAKAVHLTIEILPDNTISATIVDEGIGFDYKGLTEKIQSDEVIWEESGRGISLVCCLTDKLTFSQKGTAINFLKKVQNIG